jgi:hypothetical protein
MTRVVPLLGRVRVNRKTSRDAGGEYVLVETILRPGATVAAAHVHPPIPVREL